MTTPTKTLIDLGTKFWRLMLDQDTDAALQVLHDPALMASSHGAMRFDHPGYRKIAEQGSMTLTSFALGDVEVMFPAETTAVLTYRVEQKIATCEGGPSTTQCMVDTSTWVCVGQRWQCVLHTESQMGAKPEESPE